MIILDMNELSSARSRMKGRVVYVRGSFDILHAGHIEFLEYAKQQGDVLVVGVISDQVIAQNKGKDRPIRPRADRLKVIDAIKSVDYAFIVPAPVASKSATEIVIEILKPHIFVLFHEKTAHTKHFAKLLKQHDVKLILDNSNKKASTTQFIAKIRGANKKASEEALL